MKLNNNSNKLVICILVLSLLFISIGYSYLQTTLSIDGDVSFSECLSNTHKVKILGQTMTYYDDDKCSEFVTSNTGINFNAITSDTNGKGLYLMAGTENDENPIFYFRGGEDKDGDGVEDALNNHVLFGGFCWKIVRTTEKGGTKIIYDGVPDENNQCNNTGVYSQIGTSAFSSYYNTLADVGYMYGTKYHYWPFDSDTAYVYGSDVTYSNGFYALENATSNVDTISNIKTKHYTCKSLTNGTCSTVYYVIGSYNGNVDAISLTEGKKLDDIINESFVNKNDSKIKTTIDVWFKENLASKASKLEDAVWCNDRSIASGGYLQNGDATRSTYFGTYSRIYTLPSQPTLKDAAACPNKNDRFTVSDTIYGNGALIYSVGLLTADEVMIAGNGRNGAYLYTGQDCWLLSPNDTSRGGGNSGGFDLKSSGGFGSPLLTESLGVRPAIVLKKDIVATSGDGSSEHPYVVE